jgi:isopenicillin-N epimerase
VVLEAQRRFRDRLESEPVSFMLRELEGHLDQAREILARLVHAEPDDLVFLPNATSGVNTVLRSLDLSPGDEVLTTDHSYGACRNSLDFVAERTGARVVTARVPFPLASSDEVVDAVLGAVTPRTRLALLDHVTSMTALVWPIARIVSQLTARGVDTLVDGAHAPGMSSVDLTEIGAAYYAANCHKWLCAPKGAAFLHVRRDRQDKIRPLVISHGATSLRPDRSRFRLEFDWMGTVDPTPYLCIPEAIRFLEGLMPGGLTALAKRNRAVVLAGRDMLASALAVAAPAPDAMIGAMATLPLPGPVAEDASLLHFDPLQNALFSRHRIEVPVFCWGTPRRRWLRIAAQAYNFPEQYERLAQAIVSEMGYASSR